MSHLKTWEGVEDYSKDCELPHSKRSKRQESKVCCLLLILLTFGDCHATYDSNLEDRRKKLNIVMLSKRKLIFYHEKKKKSKYESFESGLLHTKQTKNLLLAFFV